MAAVVGWAAYEWIPMLEYPGLRYLAWAGYGYLQGLIWTGLWVGTLSKEEVRADP